MAVDAQMSEVLDLIAAIDPPPPRAGEHVRLREDLAALCLAFGPGDTSVATEDLMVNGPAGQIPVRVYRPAAAATSTEPLHALVWFHGGGFALGSIDTHDAMCRNLTAATGWAVIGVEYRLAPEHPYPAAHDDAEAAFAELWARSADLGLHPQLAVGGDSAGGALAAAVTHRRHVARSPLPSAQVLYYPVLDLGGVRSHASRTANASGYLLTTETVDYFAATYLPDGVDRGATELDLLGSDLGWMPPTMVVTAEFDPLRDEGRELSATLEAAGVELEAIDVEGGIHLFAQVLDSELAHEQLRRLSGWLASLVRP